MGANRVSNSMKVDLVLHILSLRSKVPLGLDYNDGNRPSQSHC